MDATWRICWELTLEKITETIQNSEENAVMYNDAEDLFFSNCNHYYRLMQKFMKERDKYLDRHKVAAVVACAIVDTKVAGISAKSREDLEQAKRTETLVNAKIAVNVALAYMYSELQRVLTNEEEWAKLERNKIPYTGTGDNLFSQYHIPKCWSSGSGNKTLADILCSDLHFAKELSSLNPLLLSSLFFMIEAYSFERDPNWTRKDVAD